MGETVTAQRGLFWQGKKLIGDIHEYYVYQDKTRLRVKINLQHRTKPFRRAKSFKEIRQLEEEGYFIVGLSLTNATQESYVHIPVSDLHSIATWLWEQVAASIDDPKKMIYFVYLGRLKNKTLKKMLQVLIEAKTYRDWETDRKSVV